MEKGWQHNYDLGKRSFEERKYDTALQYLEKVAAEKNQFADVYNMLGYILQQLEVRSSSSSTLGTGWTEHTPPADWFADYYAFLENDLGFHSAWVRTDYQFASLDEAVDLLSFFWDDEFGGTARRNNRRITPECTGVWWKEVQRGKAGPHHNLCANTRTIQG